MSPRISSPAHPGSGGGGGGGGTPGGGRGRGRGAKRDNSLIGKTVKIIGGPFKGYYQHDNVDYNLLWECMTHNYLKISTIVGHVGIVKDSTEDTARVELHTNCKTISVDINRLGVTGYVFVIVHVLLFY